MHRQEAAPRNVKQRLRRIVTIGAAAPLLAGAALVAPIGGGEASAACAVTSSLRQTSASQTSDSVKCLQSTLNAKGYNSGPVDGWFGPMTANAVRSFQQANGLTVDGWVGRQTRGALGITANFGGGGGQQAAPARQQQRQAPAPRASGGGGSRGNCASFAGLFAANGLPVETFKRIAYRESGCNPGAFVSDHDDLGGGLLGINFKGGNAGVWMRLCGATVGQVTNASVNVRCAAAAYRQSGLRPWGGGA